MIGKAFLRMIRISKSFPGVQALEDVTLSVHQGEIHGIVGENGAGKSTLMKVLAGVYPYGTYEGEFYINGQQQRFGDILEAEASGVVMIPQELVLVPDLSVAENMFLNAWPGSIGLVRWDDLSQQTNEMLERLGVDVNPGTRIKELSAAKQQLILIGKALAKNAKILILDEPTSALTEDEIEILFDNLRRLKEAGITSLFISHKIDEIKEITDRVTVLRDGKQIATEKTLDLTPDQIVRMMVGRSISEMYPRRERAPGNISLNVEGITLYDPNTEHEVVTDVSFEVREGEIVGLAGLIGAGRTQLLLGIFGAWPGRVEGEIHVRGKKTRISSPQDAMRLGIGLLPEERKSQGLVEGKGVAMNITLASLEKVSHWSVIDSDLERDRSERFVKDLNIRTSSIDTLVENLSGGNQQKVVVARWLSAESEILLLDEPTKGIDVGAKVEIFHLLNSLAHEGRAIIFVSSELLELLGIADRILVMCEGKLRADIPWQEATEEKVMYYATGHY